MNKTEDKKIVRLGTKTDTKYLPTVKINNNDAIQIKYIWDGDYFKFYIGKNLILIIPYEKFRELKYAMQRF